MRVNGLTRTGMVPQALDFILKENPKFEVSKEEYEEADKSRVYNPRKGTTSKKWEKVCNKIDDYLDKHYLMYFLDYTHPDDHGSRDEAVLVCKKPEYDKNTNDFLYYKPDFTKDIIACFYR